MAYLGFHNRILRVNLSTKAIQVEQPGEAFYRTYMGGRNVAAYYLLKEVPGDTDPFGPDNKIVVATSIVTGTQIPGSSRFTVASKSPLTEGYGDGESGGWFGPELKFAGYDAIIIEGVAEEPVYLAIKDGDVEIRSAAELWGKDTGEVQELIKEDMGESRTRVIQCGPGGENLVRFANVVNELHHFVGRAGIGAVMGSKKLRAIAVRGTQKVTVKDAEKIKSFAKWFAQHYQEHPNIEGLSQLGTAKHTVPVNEFGLLPTRNFTQGQFEGADSICGDKIKEVYGKKHSGCYACPIRCKQIVGATGKDFKHEIDEAYGAPEFETIGSIGSNCAIDDVEAICKANELCGRYGIDTIGTGVTIAFAMECYEKGILTDNQTGGIPLNFGNAESMLKLIELIAKREGIGELLAQGSYRAAQTLGQGAEKFTMTVKKQELPGHEPRGKWNVALGFALSTTGADHLIAAHDPCFMGEGDPEPEFTFTDITDLHEFGFTEPLPSPALGPKKVRMFTTLQSLWSLYNVLDICIFVGLPENRMMRFNQLVEQVEAVTGWKTNIYELMKVGERSVNLSRAFNLVCGLTKADDSLPERLFEPLQRGPFEGTAIDRQAFGEAIDLHYEMMGWNREGVPQKGKLVDLDIAWVEPLLES